MAVNYGLNKVRFPAPVPAGSKVRLSAELLTVEDIAGGIRIALRATIHCTALESPCASPTRVPLLSLTKESG
ncbi:hypothetical protein WSS_A33405 [Rhodococcus opacus M213]|uniref:MaoC-like domain-containing protein n=1 Tax=Rhodococcus opacus M213 TaxID=1129896 RepID=K8XBR5_RHOOP|nr:hypothetical protein [Rhodococcus opacus]EKT78286.1 hypothetical protein WSS_A33405 [Rhodococcus opacus M213]